MLEKMISEYGRMKVAQACERVTGLYPESTSELKKYMLGEEYSLLRSYIV